MFSKKARQPRQARPARNDRDAARSLDRGGYPGLEGDFESERRRAASESNSHESAEPYEHGEGESPVLPVNTPGQTHP